MLGIDLWTVAGVVLLASAFLIVLRFIERNAQRSHEALHRLDLVERDVKAHREELDDLERLHYPDGRAEAVGQGGQS